MTAAGLAMGRRVAESLMRDRCTITHTGVQTWNPVTKQYDTGTTTVYDGVCRIRPTGNMERAQNAADQAFVEALYTVSLPVVSSLAVLKGDTVTVTASASDPELVGRKFTIIGAPAYSDGTARRFPVRETQ